MAKLRRREVFAAILADSHKDSNKNLQILEANESVPVLPFLKNGRLVF